MKGLLLAEKPSVMRAIQEVYKKEAKNYPDTLEFGAFHGHLMRLQDPEEYDPAWGDKRDVTILPMLPSEFLYQPDDEESVDKLMKKIRAGKYDFLINACDAGREGEHIFWSFYETEGLKLPVKRFWASSITSAAIKKALGNLQDASVYDGMRRASKYRAQFDWLVGMNFTRAATSRLYAFTPIGRVQSPTLKLIVDRERQIRDFVSEPFYEVKGRFLINGAGPAVFTHLIGDGRTKDTRFKTEAEAQAVVDAVKPLTGQVAAVKEDVKEEHPPTLYSLAELQKSANKLFKWKPDKTLDIAQKLYEDGFTTYPRTESRFLPTDMIAEIPAHLKPVAAVPALRGYVSAIGQTEIDAMVKGGRYIDDAKITDHHAIIPTDSAPNWNSLSKDEQALYDMICRSFLAIFMPPYRYSQTKIISVFGGKYLFAVSGKTELDEGYHVLYASPKSKKQSAASIPPCKNGDPVTIQKIGIKPGATTPPARYTPDTMLAAMQNAGQQLSNAAMRKVLKESAGLGTSATRASILKRMEDRELIAVQKNCYVPLPKGEKIIDAVGDRTFCSALLTAQWEEKLRKIEDGTFSGDFRAEMDAYIREGTAYLLDNLKGVAPERAEVGNCPCCGRPVYAGKNNFYCSGNMTKECEWSSSRTIKGTTLKDSDMKAMLETGYSPLLTFRWKNGKTGRATLHINQSGKLDWLFEDNR